MTVSGMTDSTTTLPEYDRRKVEGDPMIYIVTMLIVFSAGIASLMIIYMKKVRDKLGLGLYLFKLFWFSVIRLGTLL